MSNETLLMLIEMFKGWIELKRKIYNEPIQSYNEAYFSGGADTLRKILISHNVDMTYEWTQPMIEGKRKVEFRFVEDK